MTIPVICDRCRTAGTAGTGDFSHFGDLLEFEPVAVQPRINGWNPDAQRAFIALLATTGSKSRAALAIGRNAFGIGELTKRPDGASLKTAMDRALAIAKTEGTIKLATGVADAAARHAHLTPPSRLRGHAPKPVEQNEGDEEAKFDLLQRLFAKHLLKVTDERAARLAGDVVAADFYLRQITVSEVVLDLMGEGLGLDIWQTLIGLRRDGHTILEIAETPMSRELDDRRREQWAAIADPERPVRRPQTYLEVFGNLSLEPLETLGPASPSPPGMDPEAWRAMTRDEQESALAERHRQAAEEQVAWEAQAQSGRRPDED